MANEGENFEGIKSSCEMRDKVIQPKILNNIYNKLVRVLNNEHVNQTLHIQECM